MNKTIVAVLLLLLTGTSQLSAHCEVPCGIYDDTMRVKMLSEHILTIEKSIAEIRTLEAAEPKNYNQLVRWVANKDLHATQLQEIVWQYFMTQRLKPVEPGKPGYDQYIKELTLLHQLSIFAMKAKQSLDPENIRKMRELLKDFEQSYLLPDKHAAETHHQ